MDFARKLFLYLNRSNNRNSCKSEKNKDNDDPGNVAYEAIEWGYKYPEEEIGCGINLMKHRNEL